MRAQSQAAQIIGFQNRASVPIESCKACKVFYLCCSAPNRLKTLNGDLHIPPLSWRARKGLVLAPDLKVDVDSLKTDSWIGDRLLQERQIGNLGENAAFHAVSVK